MTFKSANLPSYSLKKSIEFHSYQTRTVFTSVGAFHINDARTVQLGECAVPPPPPPLFLLLKISFRCPGFPKYLHIYSTLLHLSATTCIDPRLKHCFPPIFDSQSVCVWIPWLRDRDLVTAFTDRILAQEASVLPCTCFPYYFIYICLRYLEGLTLCPFH